MAVYLSPLELLNYYDQRRVLEMASDTGAPETLGGLPANTRVLTAIRSASAELDSHLQTGRRYERSQLQDVCTAADAGGATDDEKKRAAPIKELVAHLAFGRLMARRGYSAQKMQELAPMYAVAQEQLNLLASGERIFDLDAPKAAGVPSRVGIGENTLKWSSYSRMFGVFPSYPVNYLYPFTY